MRWNACPPARQIKLYNAGSFFDPQAIPPEEDANIAAPFPAFERVIVEAHPAFIGKRCLRFKQQLAGRLEVAIGLETVHPRCWQRLNKRFTVADFQRSADFLAANGIDLRVFLLLRPPFMSEAEGLEWAKRSLDVAFDAGATACCPDTHAGRQRRDGSASERGLVRPARPPFAGSRAGVRHRFAARARVCGFVGCGKVLYLCLFACPHTAYGDYEQVAVRAAGSYL